MLPRRSVPRRLEPTPSCDLDDIIEPPFLRPSPTPCCSPRSPLRNPRRPPLLILSRHMTNPCPFKTCNAFHHILYPRPPADLFISNLITQAYAEDGSFHCALRNGNNKIATPKNIVVEVYWGPSKIFAGGPPVEIVTPLIGPLIR